MVGNNLGPHAAGVFFHLHHQIGPLDMAFARPVFHFGGDRQLTAGLNALHQKGFQHGAAGIDASGVTSGAGADDQNAGVAGVRHVGFLGRDSLAER